MLCYLVKDVPFCLCETALPWPGWLLSKVMKVTSDDNIDHLDHDEARSECTEDANK